MTVRYVNRHHGGKLLGEALKQHGYDASFLLLGLPRGGVPVAAAAAAQLAARFDIFVVRKLGVPDEPELAMGAICEGAQPIFNYGLMEKLGVDEASVAAVVAREQTELARRLALYRKRLPVLQLEGQKVILVDDGLATGASMRAAALAIKQRRPASVHIASPVGSPEACAMLAPLVDGLLCVHQPQGRFWGVGSWYRDFAQTSDDEVAALLEQIKAREL